jgi:hypothetical protein
VIETTHGTCTWNRVDIVRSGSSKLPRSTDLTQPLSESHCGSSHCHSHDDLSSIDTHSVSVFRPESTTGLICDHGQHDHWSTKDNLYTTAICKYFFVPEPLEDCRGESSSKQEQIKIACSKRGYLKAGYFTNHSSSANADAGMYACKDLCSTSPISLRDLFICSFS